MPDFNGFSITPLGSVSVNLPRARIEARLLDPSDQNVILADYTGPDALVFPGVITTLTAQQRRELVELIATWLIETKAGLR